MTQDWIAQGILRTQLVDVVDPRAVFVQGQAACRAVDPVTLAHRTGAAMVISGSYYRTGDTLFVQAAVTDARTGRIVRVVGPILSSVRTPVAALDELRSRVMTALAATVDVHAPAGPQRRRAPPVRRLPGLCGWVGRILARRRPARQGALPAGGAPRYRVHSRGPLRRVRRRRTPMTASLVDSLTRALDARSQPLDRMDRLSLQIADARCHGRNEEMLRLTLERADLEPGNSATQMPAAAAALWANRPKRALELLARVNPAVDLAWSTDTTHFAYWSGLTEALHQLGRHREELAAADRLPPGAPLSRVWLRGTALAALSRPTAGAGAAGQRAGASGRDGERHRARALHRGTARVHRDAGLGRQLDLTDLAVHGDTVASRQAAMRAVAWYRGRPAEERSTPEERLVASWSLEMLGEYAEAEGMARGLVAEDSDNVDFRGELAGLAAERGDTALADSLDRWLAAQPVARVSWTASMYRARVAALLGRRDSAVARTREAFDEGAWPGWLHQEPALAPLRGRADFAALTRPRD